MSPRAMFLVMSAIWGATWIAIKIGVSEVPPMQFAGSRFVVAGLLLLATAVLAGDGIALPRRILPRLCGTLLLTVTGTYSLLFWAMGHVATGLAAVINLSIMPVALFVFAVAAGQERFAARPAIAILIGITGLAVLFQGAAVDGMAEAGTLGIVAVIGATLCYAAGSVLARPMLRDLPTLPVSGWQLLAGGVSMLLLSPLFEPWSLDGWRSMLQPEVAASWLFLVVFGSYLAFTMYLRLLRDWGASRAGLYAFVSPVVAVILGVLVYGEVFGAAELAGSALMLAAAWLAMPRDRLAAAGAPALTPDGGRP